METNTAKSMFNNKTRGSWKSVVLANHLGESAKIKYPSFSPTGQKLSFIRRFDGEDHLWLFSIEKEELTLLSQVTKGNGLKGTALYGDGLYTWRYNSQKELLVCCDDDLKILNVLTGEMKKLYPFAIGASQPVESNREIASTVTPNNTCMRVVNLSENNAQWPVPLPPKTDFAINSTFSRNGDWLAWHAWDFPNMAWDTSFIVTYSKNDPNAPYNYKEPGVSMAQPNFSPVDDVLAFLSDKKGWLNLWYLPDPMSYPEPLVLEEAEHGFPVWSAGQKTFDWLPDAKHIIYIRNRKAETELVMVNTLTKETQVLDFPSGVYEHIDVHPIKNKAVVIYSSPKIPQKLMLLDLDKNTYGDILQGPVAFPTQDFVEPIHISFPTKDGENAHALLWVKEREDAENAPVIVSIHGGPTSQSKMGWNPKAQFFAMRGYVYAELNHRGSTGYGREYIQKLTGNWGVVDAADSYYLLRYLEKRGMVDSSRSAIIGGSAGGYNVLQTLINYPDSYSCGINLYGVTDLFHLADMTHYFESHYLDKLVGSLPEESEKYKTRSPIYNLDELKTPLLVLQGAKDKVVPKEQSDMLVDSLKKKGVAVEYHVYPNEGHGFKKRQTVTDSYERMLRFLRKELI